MSLSKATEQTFAQLQSQYEQLHQLEELYQSALSMTNHSIVVIDIPKRTLKIVHDKGEWNGVKEVMPNVPESVIDTGIIHADHQAGYRQYFEDIFNGVPEGEYTVCVEEKNRGWVWFSMHYQTAFDEKGSPSKAIIFASDLTDQILQEKSLRKEAETDSLCGLYNRRMFEKCVEDILLNDRRVRGGYLFMIDIDDFKDYNDNHGHLVGDEILRGLGESLGKCFRKEDVLGRFGGDEFMVFASNITQERALLKAEELDKQLEQFECSVDLFRPVTLSIGIAEVADSDDFTSLYRKSDEALYVAKSRGKSCSVLWDEKTSKRTA